VGTYRPTSYLQVTILDTLEALPQLGHDKDRVLIGDNMQGYCLAYDFAAKRFGEFSDFGAWSSFDQAFDLAAFLARDGA